MRFLVCLAAVVFLTGCNLVITHKPMFTAADGASGPVLRPGLWRMEGDTPCTVDEVRPLKEWPHCAGGVVMAAGTVGYFDTDGDAPVWRTDPLILVAGKPIIGQVKIKVSGNGRLTGDAYAYVGLRSTRLDAAGRFTGFEFWPVQCGPPSTAPNRFFTEHPAAGVKVEPVTSVPDVDKTIGPLCTIDNPDIMRRVAAQSETWVPKPGVGHWVRDNAD